MDNELLSAARERLVRGALQRFGDRLDPGIPRVAAGCYTVWDDRGRFMYAGMAGRDLSAVEIAAAIGQLDNRVIGLRDRLAAHRNGRRSGDQFAVYVFDRLVLCRLGTDDIRAACEGRRRLDDDVQRYIRSQLSYRWHQTLDGTEAYALEKTLVSEGLDGVLPFLNPRKVEEP